MTAKLLATSGHFKDWVGGFSKKQPCIYLNIFKNLTETMFSNIYSVFWIRNKPDEVS